MAMALALATGCDDGGGDDMSSGGTTGGEASTGTTKPDGPDGDGSSSADGEGSSGGDAGACGFPSVPTVCGKDAPQLGAVDGGFFVDTIPVVWSEYLPDCDTTVAEPVMFWVPENVVSLGATLQLDGTTDVLFGGVSNEGTVLLDASLPFGEHGALLAPPLRHAPGKQVSIALPISDETELQWGCVALQPYASGNVEGAQSDLHVVTRTSPDETESGSTLSFELVLVDGVDLDLDALDQAMLHAASILDAADTGPLEVWSVDVVSLDSGPYVPHMGPEIDALRASYIPTDDRSMVVYLIEDFVDQSGLAGIAAGLPGPNGIPGTNASGVVVSIGTHRQADGSLATNILGETIAHEAGHQIGLFHTSERDGSNHDLAHDSPTCTLDMDANGDGSLTADECPDGQNLMFWTGSTLPQDELSPQQSDVLYFTPIAR